MTPGACVYLCVLASSPKQPHKLEHSVTDCIRKLSWAVTEDLTNQWMQYFPLIYQTDCTTAVAFHFELMGI